MGVFAFHGRDGLSPRAEAKRTSTRGSANPRSPFPPEYLISLRLSGDYAKFTAWAKTICFRPRLVRRSFPQ
jgi:hypothetical protein